MSIQEGQQYVVQTRDELPLKLLDFLGHGGTASVEKVQDQGNGAIYARKIFKFNGGRKEALRVFDNEIEVIKRLSQHHHIIRVFATYVAKREVGLLLTPVADRGSLDDLLQGAPDDPLSAEDTKLLWSSFGCLVSGLHFMHTQRVRHKDIKPHNILIHQNSFIYTDFGCSLDYGESTRSITTGLPTSVTQRYAAPEISRHEPRSSKTDVFSLGCVFVEILCALNICTETRNMTPYREHIDKISSTISESSCGSASSAAQFIVTTLTGSMLSFHPENRISAEAVLMHLREHQSMFCTHCSHDIRRRSDTIAEGVDVPSRHRDDTFTALSAGPVNERTMLTESPEVFACSRCELTFKSNLNLRKHGIEHVKCFYCNVPNCIRSSLGFLNLDDLNRHKEHEHAIRIPIKFYKCASKYCRDQNRVWLYVRKFTQHIHIMHKSEDPSELIERSAYLKSPVLAATAGEDVFSDDNFILLGAQRFPYKNMRAMRYVMSYADDICTVSKWLHVQELAGKYFTIPGYDSSAEPLPDPYMASDSFV